MEPKVYEVRMLYDVVVKIWTLCKSYIAVHPFYGVLVFNL